jgi:hypothetical protein
MVPRQSVLEGCNQAKHISAPSSCIGLFVYEDALTWEGGCDSQHVLSDGVMLGGCVEHCDGCFAVDGLVAAPLRLPSWP